jgi:aminopeptidase N
MLLNPGSALRGAEQEQICRYCAQEEGQHARSLGVDLPGDGFRYAPDRLVDVLHIKLNVTPDFSRRTVSGTASIRFAPISRPLEELRLDAVDLTIQAVRSDGAAIADFSSSRQDLTIVFAAPVGVGQQATIDIDFEAEPTRGLYFRTPQMGYPETDAHVWTQGEAHEARHWFPCFDYPNERSSTEMICHVPPDMTVLSNGRLVSEMLDPESGLKAVHWLQEKPHVNYLICLVAGHFKKLEKRHRDIPLGFYTQPSLFVHAANSFRDTAQIMKFFEEEIGVPFPWNKYDQVTIRDFVAGGMENTTLTTLTHGTIFSDKTENIRTTRRLDAHEMAHQWFGDYVTCKDWSHLWLNEGFATYYAHLYEGHKFGRDALLYGLYGDAKRIFRQNGDTKPIAYKAYKNASEQFDYRAYPKGSWVLHMLRSQLGERLYRQCVQAYLQEHALSSVVTDDLRQVIEEHSGRTFDRFFDQWVYHARHPDVKVSYRWLGKEKLAKVTVAQTHKVNGDVLLFHFPTVLRFVLKGGRVVDHSIHVTEPEQDFYAALPRQPDIVRFDPHYTVLADVAFQKPDAMLFAQLENREDVIGRLLAVEALGERGTQQAVDRLQRALRQDPFFGVRTAASRALARIHDDAAFAALQASRQQEDARVRQQVTTDLCGFFRPETLDIIEEITQAEKNPAIRASAIRALGKFHGPRSRRLIQKSLRSNSFRNELADAAIAAIGAQHDPSYRQPLMTELADREPEFTSRGFGQGLTALALMARDEKDQGRVRDFLTSYLQHPRQATRRSAISALGTLRDPASIPVLEALAKGNRDDRIQRAVDQALAALRATKPAVPAELVELRRELAELKKSHEDLRREIDDLKKRATTDDQEEPSS